MTDHRRLQRTLFRMQLDATFARAVFRGDVEALRSTELGADELALLRALDPAGVEADPGGRRRSQVVCNAASEYALTVALAEARGDAPGLLDGFARSRELHEAVRRDDRLPFAFGAYAQRRARELARPRLAAIAALEAALARARRGEAGAHELAPGEVVRNPRARLVELPDGTFALAESLRAALDAGAESQIAAKLGPGAETLLLFAAERAHPQRLPEVAVERLEPAVAALLALAERPLGPAERARFARDQGAEPEELERFVDALAADALLLRATRRKA